jgi:hypothetical protein
MVLHCIKENGKLYFGKVSFISWVKAYFGTEGRLLVVKPLKGYENYHYFKNQNLHTSPNYGLLVNDFYTQKLTNIKNLPEYLNRLYEEQAKRLNR